MSTFFIQPPEFVSAFEIKADQPLRPWRNPPHMHSNTEIFFVQEGEGEFIVGNTLYRPKRGDLIVHHPLVEHQEASVKGSAFQAISIQLKGLQLGGKPVGRIVDEHESPIIHFQHDYDKINQYLGEVLSEYYEEKPGYIELNSSLLQTLILLLLRYRQAAHAPALSSVSDKVKAYIEENYKLELTLTDLADIAHVSSYHLAHVFKEEVGVSPIQYLIRCRIEEAKNLLTRTERSIADISAEVGYPNANYFNILFKKVTGVNPGKFRSKRG